MKRDVVESPRKFKNLTLIVDEARKSICRRMVANTSRSPIEWSTEMTTKWIRLYNTKNLNRERLTINISRKMPALL